MDFVSMIISLILTAIIYGLAPLFFYLKRRSPIQKRRLKAFHITYTVLVALVFAVANSLNGISINFAPAAIWGTLFYHVNKSKLSDKGLLILNHVTIPSKEAQQPVEAPVADIGDTSISGSTREIPNEYIEEYGEFPAGEKPCRTVKPLQRELFNQAKVQRSLSNAAPVSHRKFKVSVSLILALLLFVCIAGNVYQLSETLKLTDALAELTEERDKLSRETALKTETISQLSQEVKRYQENEERLEFYDSSIRFVVDGSDYYHTYDCAIFQNEEYFWSAHNIEFCRWLDYSPCPLCKRGRLVKITP